MTETQVDVLVQGYPGTSPSNGGLGWSTVGLVRAADRVILVDAGPFGARPLVRARLAARGVALGDVTDVVLTHVHHDHSVNWPMFPDARIHIAAVELDWAVSVPPGSSPVPEFSVRALASSPQTVKLDDDEEIAPGISTHLRPGHTPGSVVVQVLGDGRATMFVGDAAKNRAELHACRAQSAIDAQEATRSIAKIVDWWRGDPANVVVPGHDLPLVLDDGTPTLVGDREVAVDAVLGLRLDEARHFPLGAE